MDKKIIAEWLEGFISKQTEMFTNVDILEAFAAEFVPQWVSVDDRLPNESEDVLMRYEHIYNGKSSEHTYNGFYYCGKWHFSEEGEYIGDNRTVTHWQPLPPPPTK